MVAADKSIHNFVLWESKYRADQRQMQFQSEVQRFPDAKPEAKPPPGPGEYPGAAKMFETGLEHYSQAPTIPRSHRFKHLSQKELEETQGADPYFSEALEAKRGWASKQSRTISRIGRNSPAIGAAPDNARTDRFYNTQKNDLGRALKKSGNQYVGMRSKQRRFKDAHPPQTAAKVGPGGYNVKHPWEMQNQPAEGRVKRQSFFMRKPGEKIESRRKPTNGKGSEDGSAQGDQSPGPGSYDYDPGFGRSQSVMSTRSGSSAFLSPGRGAGNGRASRIARRVAEDNSMAIPSGTEQIDTTWKLAHDAKKWTARGASATETFVSSVAKMDRPFERATPNRSPSVGRGRLREASVRHETVYPSSPSSAGPRAGRNSGSNWGASVAGQDDGDSWGSPGTDPRAASALA